MGPGYSVGRLPTGEGGAGSAAKATTGTLRRWVANLEAHREAAIRSASPERERAWTLYMLASAQAFERGELTVYQVLSARPGASPRLPLDRLQLLSTGPPSPGGPDQSEDHERSTSC